MKWLPCCRTLRRARGARVASETIHRRKSCATCRGERRSPEALHHSRDLVIVLVPIVLGVPAMRVFVPPLVLGFPATLALGCEFAAPVSGFLAVGAMLGNGVVQVMVNLDGFALTAIIRANLRG